MNDEIAVIANPAAGRGGIRAKLPRSLEILRARGISKVYETSAPGDEETLAHHAIREGATTIVAIGGDGTCGRIADVIIRSNSRCRLTVVPSGTGNDFAKTLGLEKYDARQIADLLFGSHDAVIDVGFVSGHYFLNSCGFGFDASVLEASNDVRFLKGDAVYIYSALKQLFTYRGITVSSTAHSAAKRGKMLMVTVSNGRSLGGAFRIAPQASVLDGKLDVCFFGDANFLKRAQLFLAAMKGKHIGMAGVFATATQHLELSFDFNPAMEVDGELRLARSRTVELKCIPRALAVIAAPGALI